MTDTGTRLCPGAVGWERRACRGYNVYREARRGIDEDGETIPRWLDLDAITRAAWVLAAKDEAA